MTYYVKNHFSSFWIMLYLHLINDRVMKYNTSNRHIYSKYLRTQIMHLGRSANKLEIQVLRTSMQNFMCPFIVMMLTWQCSVNIFWMIHINKLINMLYKPFFNPPQGSMMVFNKISYPYVWMSFICVCLFHQVSCQITIHSKFVNIFKFCEKKA
jgi:hypothetical protein